MRGDAFLRDHPATVEVTGGRFSSARVASDHPLPVGLAAVVAEVTGRVPALRGEPYGADMRLLVQEGARPRSSSARATSRWPTPPTSTCHWTRS